MSSNKRYTPPRIDPRGSVIAGTMGQGSIPAELMPPNPTPLIEDGLGGAL
jgi:hypothetical protein